MNLKNQRPSKNFEDRTGGSLKDSTYNLLYRIMFPMVKMMNPDQLSPQANDAYLERIRKMGPPQADYMNMSVKDFTPEEWDLVKKNGWGLDDIMILRKHNALRR